MLIHTGENTFKCKVCEKTFTQAGNLRSHMLIHTRDRLFKCKVCEKKFKHADNIKNT